MADGPRPVLIIPRHMVASANAVPWAAGSRYAAGGSDSVVPSSTMEIVGHWLASVSAHFPPKSSASAGRVGAKAARSAAKRLPGSCACTTVSATVMATVIIRMHVACCMLHVHVVWLHVAWLLLHVSCSMGTQEVVRCHVWVFVVLRYACFPGGGLYRHTSITAVPLSSVASLAAILTGVPPTLSTLTPIESERSTTSGVYWNGAACNDGSTPPVAQRTTLHLSSTLHLSYGVQSRQVCTRTAHLDMTGSPRLHASGDVGGYAGQYGSIRGTGTP